MAQSTLTLTDASVSNETRLPSPDEIRRRAAEIRRGWSPEVRRQREAPLPGWPLLPLILGSPRLRRPAASAPDRSRRGR